MKNKSFLYIIVLSLIFPFVGFAWDLGPKTMGQFTCHLRQVPATEVGYKLYYEVEEIKTSLRTLNGYEEQTYIDRWELESIIRLGEKTDANITELSAMLSDEKYLADETNNPNTSNIRREIGKELKRSISGYLWGLSSSRYNKSNRDSIEGLLNRLMDTIKITTNESYIKENCFGGEDWSVIP